MLIIFKPLFLQGKIPFPSNLLASFYSPWAQEKFPGWETGIPNKPIGIDDLRIFYPQRSLTTEIFKKMEIPLWNPYSFSGNTQLGLSETAVFYPLSAIFLILPQLPSWILLILIQPVLASIGTYLFLNLLFKEKKAVLFGAITFGFCGVVTVRMVEGLSVGHTLIWLPFVIYGIEAFLQKHKLRYLLVSLLALVCSLLSGWFQFAFYIYAFSFLYAFFRIFNRSLFKIEKKNLLVFIPFIILPLVTLYQIIPALQMLLASPRGINTYNIVSPHLMPWQHIFTYLFPDLWGNPGSYNFFGRSEYKESILYIGLIPIFLALMSLYKFKSSRLVKFFSISSVVALVLGINNPLSDLIIRLPIPIVSSFLPNRIFLIASFSLSILSAFGLNYLLSEYKTIAKKKYLIVLGIMFCLIAVVDVYEVIVLFMSKILESSFYINTLKHSIWQIGLITSESQMLVQFKNIIVPNLIFLSLLVSMVLFIKQKFNPFIFFVLILLVTIGGQIYFAQKYIAFSQREFVFPQNEVFTYLQKNAGINRFITSGEGYIASNFPLFYRLYSPDGVSSMYVNRYGELVAYVQSQGKSMKGVPRIETRIDPLSREFFALDNKYLLRFMQIDGIKYVVKLRTEKESTGINTNGNNSFRLVWQNNIWQIFEFKDVLPRIFWTSNYEVIKNDSALLSRLFDSKFNPNTVLLEKNTTIKVDSNTTGTVKLLVYSPNTIKLETHSNGNGFIYLSDNYFPDFKVKIDGKQGEILRANYSFRAIPIVAGDHEVILYYDSTGVKFEFMIAVVVVLASVLGVVVLIKRKFF